MNAGKSAALLQANHNYQERGMQTMLFTYSGDHRFGKGQIVSRIGISAEAATFNSETDLINELNRRPSGKSIKCVLVDEAQFLTKKQVIQLGVIVDELNIPVLTFGIRTDFQGELFEGSKYLLAWADNLKEIKIKELQNIEEIFLSPLFKEKTNQQLDVYKYLKLRETTKMRDISLGGINSQNLKKLNMIKPFGFAGISYFE